MKDINMKKIITIILLLSISSISLVGCNTMKITKEIISINEAEIEAESSIYTNEEINDAKELLKDTMQSGFIGIDLINVEYAGDEREEDFKSYAEMLAVDDVIILTSDFNTNEQMNDPMFEPNKEYNNYEWVLSKNDGGDWEIRF